MAKRNSKPVIPILHHMARSGGTIISRCIGCMDGIALLSEIHPLGYEKQLINPLAQAHEWFNLFTPADIAHIRAKQPFTFTDAIQLIKKRCDERGLVLTIRDWSHIDFTGWPHNDRPSFKLTTAKVLTKHFRIVSTTTVRHPIDQWLSFKQSQAWTGTEQPLDQFLLGYRKFAETAVKIGYIRYEDFVENPSEALQRICARLKIPYDSNFRNKWMVNKSITTAPGKRDGGFAIEKRPRPEIDLDLLDRFEEDQNYKTAIKLLGYSHP